MGGKRPTKARRPRQREFLPSLDGPLDSRIIASGPSVLRWCERASNEDFAGRKGSFDAQSVLVPRRGSHDQPSCSVLRAKSRGAIPLPHSAACLFAPGAGRMTDDQLGIPTASLHLVPLLRAHLQYRVQAWHLRTNAAPYCVLAVGVQHAWNTALYTTQTSCLYGAQPALAVSPLPDATADAIPTCALALTERLGVVPSWPWPLPAAPPPPPLPPPLPCPFPSLPTFTPDSAACSRKMGPASTPLRLRHAARTCTSASLVPRTPATADGEDGRYDSRTSMVRLRVWSRREAGAASSLRGRSMLARMSRDDDAEKTRTRARARAAGGDAHGHPPLCNYVLSWAGAGPGASTRERRTDSTASSWTACRIDVISRRL
ncbi:hypothetical protein RJ55_02805 [Drechmeria coniospora]|nr:hypothetical protein RJ55_02805 [Drechmeria coniospora]